MQLLASRSVGFSFSPALPLRPSPGSEERRCRTAQRASLLALRPPLVAAAGRGGAGQGCAPRGRIPAAPAWAPAGEGGRSRAPRGARDSARDLVLRATAPRFRQCVRVRAPSRCKPTPSPTAPRRGSPKHVLGCVERNVQSEPHPPDLENRVPALNLKSAVGA